MQTKLKILLLFTKKTSDWPLQNTERTPFTSAQSSQSFRWNLSLLTSVRYKRKCFIAARRRRKIWKNRWKYKKTSSFLSIFICFYLFFLRRQRRNLLHRIHVNLKNPFNPLNHREAVCCIKTSSCGTIERIERIFVRFPQEMIFTRITQVSRIISCHATQTEFHSFIFSFFHYSEAQAMMGKG